MINLQINNPEMRDIFENKFNSNQEKFMEFIVNFIQDNKKVVDNYFTKKNSKPTFQYKKLDPNQHYYTLSVDETKTDMTNPFANIKDSVEFAKRLREESYR